MTAIEVAELPVAEKLRLMEKLWDSLRTQAASTVVPDWHKDLLSERLRQLESGTESISPWGEAKERIRAQTKAA